jgi:hypothetical protein
MSVGGRKTYHVPAIVAHPEAVNIQLFAELGARRDWEQETAAIAMEVLLIIGKKEVREIIASL